MQGTERTAWENRAMSIQAGIEFVRRYRRKLEEHMSRRKEQTPS